MLRRPAFAGGAPFSCFFGFFTDAVFCSVHAVDGQERKWYNTANGTQRSAFFMFTGERMIRALQRKDRETFLALSDRFYSSEAVLHAVPRAYHEEAFEEIVGGSPYAAGYLLESEGKAVGFALTATSYSRESGGKILWLEELYLLEEYRSRGLGREFFAFAEEFARKNGYARIRLEVEENNVRARALYERLGYEPLEYVQMIRQLRG